VYFIIISLKLCYLSIVRLCVSKFPCLHLCCLCVLCDFPRLWVNSGRTIWWSEVCDRIINILGPFRLLRHFDSAVGKSQDKEFNFPLLIRCDFALFSQTGYFRRQNIACIRKASHSIFDLPDCQFLDRNIDSERSVNDDHFRCVCSSHSLK
jgi:hypothetical protein